MEHTTIAVDLAKSVFEVAVSKYPGRVDERRRLSRAAFERFFVARRRLLVLLEACGSAHHWARRIEALGHRVILLPPHRVRPYVTGDKTDRADAKGLLEAYRNEQILAVPVKTPAQQALAALHRLRSTWIAARTARINTVRGILREFGIAVPAGAGKVAPRLVELIGGADNTVPEALHPVLDEARIEIGDLERRIRGVETQLKALARQTPAVQTLCTIPGIGLITATALVAFVGTPQRFASGRRFASYLGLTPRERSSGLRRRLGAISKRGDVYLRMLLTHGARSVLWRAKSNTPDRLRRWALDVEARRGHNKAAIALANKLARIVWSVWKRDQAFRPIPANPA